MFFENFKNKLLLILLSTIIIMPTTIFAYSNKIYVGGENVGIKVNSSGVLVVGFYKVNGISLGQKSGFKIGDVITKVDDTVIDGINDLSNNFSDKKSLEITYKRNNKEKKTYLKLAYDNGTYKTGLYVKDSIVGIGTLTFIDPETNRFGALGHEILEQTTGVRFEIKNGKIFESTVTDIKKAERSSVGEKNAIYNENNIFGNIDKNDITGIYGDYIGNTNDKELLSVSNDISLGKAYIKTVLEGKQIGTYEIEIINIDKTHSTKNILFKVTDKTLLQKGNGIVQGMSGSPIIQNDNIIGAVTHVVVDNPHKGFGILVTNMLKESK